MLKIKHDVNPQDLKIVHLQQSLEVVDRVSEIKLQVDENSN